MPNNRLALRAREVVKRRALRLRRTLNEHGWDVQRLDEDTRRHALTSQNEEVPLPEGAAEHLRHDNPYLRELRAAYNGLTDVPAAAQSLWDDGFVDDQVALPWFRGDNAYVWQYRKYRGGTEARMYLSLLDVQRRDDLGLLERLDEDGLFGAWTFRFGDRPPVSRDLIDSVAEINYLEKQIGLSSRQDLSVLDIGAGYGRLAHRMAEAFPDLAGYDCMDGVATSTFLADYYLRFRGFGDHVRSLRLDHHQKMRDRYDVAVNIHSFTECPLAAIEWWMDRVAEREVEWLLVVPNHPTELLTTERDGIRRDFTPAVEKRGYHLVDMRPRNEDPELRALIGSENHFFLFQRR